LRNNRDHLLSRPSRPLRQTGAIFMTPIFA